MSKNELIREKERTYIAQTQKIPYYPVSFQRGEGAVLYDEDGNAYIDFLASASSANLGHGNKFVADTVYEQMQRLAQYTLAYFNTEPPIRLAEKLAELCPIENAQVLFSTTGSSSIDAAIKLARGFTGRSKIISCFESYHGSTYGAISVSALSTNMRRKIGPLLPDVYHFHYPDAEITPEMSLAELEYAFAHYIPAEEVAAIIIEPIAGDAGILVPPVRWFEGLRALCDKHGILLVADEIQQGLCRTGKWFAMENFGIKPDLYVLGKSLGGGLPLGAVIGPKEIMMALDPPAHLFTLAGNTTVCAAALANIQELERLDANQMAVDKGRYLAEKFTELAERFDIIGDIRQLGLSIGVDIRKPGKPKEKDYVTTAKICYRAMELGLIMIFLNQSTLRVQPPLVITKEEIDRAIDIIAQAIDDTLNGRVSDDIFSEMEGW